MKRLFGICLLICLNSVYAADQTTKPITVILKSSQTTFTVTLSSNPTTGYRWYLKSCPQPVEPLSARYKVPNTKLVGAPGSVTWTFKVNPSPVPRVTDIQLVSMRPWEPNSTTVRNIYVVQTDSN